MGSSIKIPLSDEVIKELIRHHQAFFEPVTSVDMCVKDKENEKCPNGAGVGVQLRDQETKVEAQLDENGNLKLLYKFVIDNDRDPTNGRMYKHDEIVYYKDGSDPSYRYGYEYNGRGLNKKQWEGWLEKIKKNVDIKLTPQALKDFAEKIAPAFSRYFEKKHLETFSQNAPFLRIDELQKTFKKFIKQKPNASPEESSEDNTMVFRPFNQRSYYTIIRNDSTTEVIFNYALVDRNSKTSGLVMMQDRFILASNMLNLIGYKRNYLEPKGNPKEEGWDDFVKELRLLPEPAIEEAEKFIDLFVPAILEIPDFEEMALRAEKFEGKKPDLTEEEFHQLNQEQIEKEKELPFSKFDPELLERFKYGQEYFKPLQRVLGEELVFDVADAPVKFVVELHGQETRVHLRFTFQENGHKKSEEQLDYKETWIFEGKALKKIEHQVKAQKIEKGSPLDQAHQKLLAKINSNSLPSAKEAYAQEFAKLLTPLLAPHLAYADQKLAKENIDPKIFKQYPLILQLSAKYSIQVVEDIYSELVPLLYRANIEVKERNLLLTMLEAHRYGDLKELQKGVQSLGESLQEKAAALEKKKNDKQEIPIEEQQAFENLYSLKLVLEATFAEKYDVAYKMLNAISSERIRGVFRSPLLKVVKKQKIFETFNILQVLGAEQIALRAKEGSKWYQGQKINKAAEEKALNEIVEKGMLQVFSGSAEDLVSVLQELVRHSGSSPLSAEAKKLTERLLQDSIIQEISLAGQELSPVIQASRYFHLADNILYKNDYFHSAKLIAQLVARDKMPKSRAMESLDIFKLIAEKKVEQQRDQKLETRMIAFQQDLHESENKKDSQDPSNLDEMIDELKRHEQIKEEYQEMCEVFDLSSEVFSFQTFYESQNGKLLPTDIANKSSRELMREVEELVKLSPPLQTIQVTQKVTKALISKVIGAAGNESDKTVFEILRDLKNLHPLEEGVRSNILAQQPFQVIDQVSSIQDSAERLQKYSKILEDLAKNNLDLREPIQEMVAGFNRRGMPPTTALQGILLIGGLLLGKSEFHQKQITKTLESTVLSSKLASQLGENDLEHFGSIEKKLANLAFTQPNKNAIELLTLLKPEELSIGESILREKLLKDKTLQAFASVASDPSVLIRGFEYQQLLKQDLLAKEGLKEVQQNLAFLQANNKLVDSYGDYHHDEEDSEKQGFLKARLELARHQIKEIFKDDKKLENFKNDFEKLETAQKKLEATQRQGDKTTPEEHTKLVLTVEQLQKDFAKKMKTLKHPKVEKGYESLKKIEAENRELTQGPALAYVHFQTRVKNLIEKLEGKSNVWVDIQYGAPKAWKELTKPTTLAAMGIAPFAGVAVEMMGLRLLGSLATRAGILGWGGRVGASAVGGAAEGWAFTTLHKLGDSTFYHSEGQWDRYWQDVQSSVSVFTGLRAGHGGVAHFSQNVLAKGKLGKFFGGYATPNPGMTMAQTPMGRMVPHLTAGAAAPQLTMAGTKLTGLLSHTAGVGAMLGAGYFNRAVGWQLEDPTQPKKTWKGHLAEAVISYIQAMLSFNVANAATLGRLQGSLGQYKLKLQFMKTPQSQITIPQGIHITDLVGGKDIPLDHPILQAMSRVPRDQQLSLARKVAGAKDLPQLLKKLRKDYSDGARILLHDLQKTLASHGRIADRPTQLGYQSTIRDLMIGEREKLVNGTKRLPKAELEAELARLVEKQYDPSRYDVTFKPEVKVDEVGEVEANYYQARSLQMLEMQVTMARDFKQLWEVLTRTAVESLDGFKFEEIAYRIQKEELLRLVDRLEHKHKKLGEEIKELKEKENSAETIEKIEQKEAEFYDLEEKKLGLEMALELRAGESKDAVEDPLSTIESLPTTFGIRQKARDLFEQSENLTAFRYDKAQKDKLIELVKEYIQLHLPNNDFHFAQTTLRHALDHFTPAAKRMLQKLKPGKFVLNEGGERVYEPGELDLVLGVYFGEAEGREVPVDKTMAMARMLSQVGVREPMSVLYHLPKHPGYARVVFKGTQVINGDNILVRIRATDAEAVGPLPIPLEIERTVAEAKQYVADHPDQKTANPIYDPKTRTYRTWFMGRDGMSELRLRISEDGEVNGSLQYATAKEKTGLAEGLQKLKKRLGNNFKISELKWDQVKEAFKGEDPLQKRLDQLKNKYPEGFDLKRTDPEKLQESIPYPPTSKMKELTQKMSELSQAARRFANRSDSKKDKDSPPPPPAIDGEGKKAESTESPAGEGPKGGTSQRVLPHDSEAFFGNFDPRIGQINTKIKGEKPIKNAEGIEIGKAQLIAGGEEDVGQLTPADGSLVSFAVNKGGRGKNQDSGYIAVFKIGEQEVKILVGADGVGSTQGDVASGAFTQGVHAKVAESAHQGKIPTAKELFTAGVEAIKIQREKYDRPSADTTGTIAVIVGSEMTVASAGDSMLTVSYRNPQGDYETIGYTNIDNFHDIMLNNSAVNNRPNLYYSNHLPLGARITIASDGGWGNKMETASNPIELAGGAFKISKRFVMGGSDEIQRSIGPDYPPLHQGDFAAVNKLLRETEGEPNAASKLMDYVLMNIQEPGQTIPLRNGNVKLPTQAEIDNALVISCEQGDAPAVSMPSVWPDLQNYKPLKKVIPEPTPSDADSGSGTSGPAGSVPPAESGSPSSAQGGAPVPAIAAHGRSLDAAKIEVIVEKDSNDHPKNLIVNFDVESPEQFFEKNNANILPDSIYLPKTGLPENQSIPFQLKLGSETLVGEGIVSWVDQSPKMRLKFTQLSLESEALWTGLMMDKERKDQLSARGSGTSLYIE